MNKILAFSKPQGIDISLKKSNQPNLNEFLFI